jgi:hypothetical protein
MGLIDRRGGAAGARCRCRRQWLPAGSCPQHRPAPGRDRRESRPDGAPGRAGRPHRCCRQAVEQHAARLGDPSGEEPGRGLSGAGGKSALGSKPIKAWRASAFGPLPDIGDGERFVRDGPSADIVLLTTQVLRHLLRLRYGLHRGHPAHQVRQPCEQAGHQ